MVRRLFTGGSVGNEQLTAAVASALLVLLAVEGATLFNLRSLLTVHAFVGMLLIPVVALKLASTGWRMVRYYRHGEEYVRRGPPHVALRVLISPVIVLSTLMLFGTGVALLALGERHGPIGLLHKASFIVWVAATSIHVLAHLFDLRRALSRRVPGAAARAAVVFASIAAGVAVAVLTLPAADHLQDAVTGHIGLDTR
ncbi:MAG TPA: hypothetical protein VHV52_01075 [Gaiellaceae bacterium]|jgi:hypothetical protein|nr:hypothetical protein [Gaiellaceae bacterium]